MCRITVPEAKKIVEAIQQQCTRRGKGRWYKDDDARGRPPREVLAALRRVSGVKKLDPELITNIDDAAFDVPQGLNRKEFKACLEYLFAGKQRFAEKNAGRGCVLVRPNPKNHANAVAEAKRDGTPIPEKPALKYTMFQLSSNEKMDGGAFAYLRAFVKRMKTKALKKLRMSVDERKHARTASRFLGWYEKCAAAFRKRRILITQLHFVFYEEGSSLDVHRDQRLDELVSRRAIFPAPWPESRKRTRAATKPRLTFYLAQAKPARNKSVPPPKKKGRYDDQWDRSGAFCMGKVGGAVLMKAVGAGGCELLPAGVADLSGAWAAAGYDEADFPPIYLYHEPWCRGGAPADAASYVFSGYTIEE